MKKFILLLLLQISLYSFSQMKIYNVNITAKSNIHIFSDVYGKGLIKIDNSKFKAGLVDCGIQLLYNDKKNVKYIKYYNLIGQYLGKGEYVKGRFSKFEDNLKHKYVIIVFDNGYTKKIFIKNN
jgi:hypothetical protein